MTGSTTVLNHAGPTPPASGQNGFPLGRKAGKRPLQHIDDVLAVQLDTDPCASVEKLLQTAETYLRQAESARTFGRPDLALTDYIRASIIILNEIKSNKGWVQLQGDNKAQLGRYQHLVRRMSELQDDFAKLKVEIVADNARTGVQPSVVRRPTSGRSGGTAQDQNGVRQAQVDVHPAPGGPSPPPPRTRPVIQPKPQALHGNAIRPASSNPGSSPAKQEDLVQRFARLRANQGSATQDPRIRTQVIIPPNSHRPRSSVDLQSPTAGGGAAISGMPRVPDAIYNPPRGTVSSEAAELPSSAPRAMFTRTNSTTSVPNVNKIIKSAPSEEYFVPAQTFVTVPSTTPAASKRAKPSVPDGDTISVQELFRLMRAGVKDVSILLIDIRSRDLFDEGHIMSQATICLEAEVLTRPHISASDIADSMVIAPSEEQLLFEKRHEFDLVVFYDQYSTRITGKQDTAEQKAISGLYYALAEYDYPGSVTHRIIPKLLEGGIDAWSGLVGKHGLQTSSTSISNTQSFAPMARAFLSRRKTYIMRPIQDAEEARKWEATISDLETVTPIRTTEDFLRRVPTISPVQESMVAQPQSPFQSRMSHEESLYTTLPSPPTRPAPTLPRRSYSGLADNDSEAATLRRLSPLEQGVGQRRTYHTGLINPGVWCFANSSLQVMFSTPGFSRDLWTQKWEEKYKDPPKKRDERLQNHQILTRIVANTFCWLNQGNLKALECKTLMDYVRKTHEKNPDGSLKRDEEIFGGHSQQDAQEFYSFVLDNIHDETNMLRDRDPPKKSQYAPKDGTIIQNAIAYWRDYSSSSASIIDAYFRGLDVAITRCLNDSCRQELRIFQPSDLCVLPLPSSAGPTDIYKLLESHQAVEKLDAQCETCKQRGRTRQSKFARLPDRLAFCLNRFSHDGSSGLSRSAANKNHTKVRFPIRNLNLNPYCAESDPSMASTKDAHFAGQMLYDCYAVTVHVGQGINGGHYIAYVQDDQSRDPSDWWRCNDEVVEKVKIGTSLSGDLTETMFQNGNSSAYMVFYRRQGT